MEEKKIMQEIWQEALQLSNPPKTNESFFELGGNSFIASKVCLIYEEKTGKTIEIADFYEKETIDGLVG